MFWIRIHWIWIRTRLLLNLDPIRIQTKVIYEKETFISSTIIYSTVPLCLHKPLQRAFMLQLLQTWNFFIFSLLFTGLFWPAWIRIGNPDLLAHLNPDPIRFLIRNTIYVCPRVEWGRMEEWSGICPTLQIDIFKDDLSCIFLENKDDISCILLENKDDLSCILLEYKDDLSCILLEYRDDLFCFLLEYKDDLSCIFLE